jgi:hypothetical protein
MKKLLPLSYKGAREYLQGGDFYNALANMAAELAGEAGTFVERLAFRRFACMACEITTEQPTEPSVVVGQVRFRLPSGAGSQEAWLIETDSPVSGRRPFDEAALLANSFLDAEGRYVSLQEPSAYTPIEDVIALTKQLNYAVCPDVNGKWVFGQLDLVSPLPGSYQKLEIRMKSLIAGRFSVNDIFVDGRSTGTMRFIVGAPS